MNAVVDTVLAPLRENLALLQPRPAAEQRKLVAVLFADLVGHWAISVADPMHFDSPTTRIIKSGSKCSLRPWGRRYM